MRLLLLCWCCLFLLLSLSRRNLLKAWFLLLCIIGLVFVAIVSASLVLFRVLMFDP